MSWGYVLAGCIGFVGGVGLSMWVQSAREYHERRMDEKYEDDWK